MSERLKEKEPFLPASFVKPNMAPTHTDVHERGIKGGALTAKRHRYVQVCRVKEVKKDNNMPPIQIRQ